MNSKRIAALGMWWLLMVLAGERSFAGQPPLGSDSPFLLQQWTTENGLPQNSVVAIAQTPDGYLWLATFGGLARFDGVKFTIFNTANTPAMENNRITALYVAKNGALWIGGENSEVLRYFRGQFAYLPIAPPGDQLIPRAFYEDRSGNIWIGANKNALFRLPDGDPSRLEEFTEAQGLPSVNIFSFCEDKEGTLWIGTIKGLARYQHGFFTHQLKNERVVNNEITRVYPDSKDGLWLAASTGFGRYSQGHFTPVMYFPEDYNYSFGLVEDAEGNIWLVFARELIASQELERQRIAAELHDGLGQSLVVIRRRALICLETPNDSDRVREQLQEIAEASTQAIDEVREVVFDLRPQQLDRLGLTGALSDLLDRMADTHGWQLTKCLVELDGLFSKEVENSLYRIVQESLNNISKHASATHVAVSVLRSTTALEVNILDNGKGFSVDAVFQERIRGGFGLRGLMERTRLSGGQARIDSISGKGTEISLHLPLEDSRGAS